MINPKSTEGRVWFLLFIVTFLGYIVPAKLIGEPEQLVSDQERHCRSTSTRLTHFALKIVFFVALHKDTNFSAISSGEMLFFWRHDGVCFVLDQHAGLDKTLPIKLNI